MSIMLKKRKRKENDKKQKKKEQTKIRKIKVKSWQNFYKEKTSSYDMNLKLNKLSVYNQMIWTQKKRKKEKKNVLNDYTYW